MSDREPGLFPEPEDSGRDAGAPDGERPLADRYRPRAWSQFAGQEHLVGEHGPIRKLVAGGRPFSCILWGPPGTGKTTLARLIASSSGARFLEYSAVLSGVKEIRAAVETARIERSRNGRATILFVDEIHRFNKSQQDAFLPHMEDGTIHLIGATTENPSFEVNAALLSRARVFTLNPLSEQELSLILDRAVARASGDGGRTIALTDEARDWLVRYAAGDARTLLSLLELAATGESPADALEVVDFQRIAGNRAPVYDKSGEAHYNLISALHKCIRGSHADAALYWAARMMEAGEDPRYLLRRLVRIAMEDIGLAVPNALRFTLDCAETYHRLGSPEGDLAVAEAVLYLASAPKSNRVTAAWAAAREAAREHPDGAVPLHLRNAPTRLMKGMGYGKGYAYDHEDPAGSLVQEYFPEGLAGARFYEPTGRGFEKDLGARRKQWEHARREARAHAQKSGDGGSERKRRRDE